MIYLAATVLPAPLSPLKKKKPKALGTCLLTCYLSQTETHLMFEYQHVTPVCSALHKYPTPFELFHFALLQPGIQIDFIGLSTI